MTDQIPPLPLPSELSRVAQSLALEAHRRLWIAHPLERDIEHNVSVIAGAIEAGMRVGQRVAVAAMQEEEDA